MSTWTFAKTLAGKNNLSPFQKKALAEAETVSCIPKGLRKETQYIGPFAQLSYICTYLQIVHLEQLISTVAPAPAVFAASPQSDK